MTAAETTIHLAPQFFSERERILVKSGPLSAATFRYDSGVPGLRLRSEAGELELLPFQGQQIWSAEFGGRNLTMRSPFDQPRATDQYLATYGAFLVHCGATAMGVPSKEDAHPLHGELPNARYQTAYLLVGEDEQGAYVGLGGQYQHTVAFSHNYVAEPSVKMYGGSSLCRLSMSITNLKDTDMELMYLAHINYRPVDNGWLVYSAPCTPEHVRVRRSIPSHVQPRPGYVEFIEELGQHPEKANVLDPGLIFDPEIVFSIDYLAGEDGWAHSMQIHPDGSADYVRHRPDQLSIGVRWICRTTDQDAMGLVLPATAEPEGYLAEKAKGNIKTLPAKEEFRFEIDMGTLTPAEAERVADTIEKIVAS